MPPRTVASARKGVDGADASRLFSQRAREPAGRLLERYREDQAVEVRNAHQLREAGVEIPGKHVDRDQNRIAAATHQFRRDHLRRADLRDRVPDDPEDAGLAGNIVDFVHVGAFRPIVPSPPPRGEEEGGRRPQALSVIASPHRPPAGSLG